VRVPMAIAAKDTQARTFDRTRAAIDRACSRLRQAFALPIFAAAVLLVLLGVLGILLWPAWSEDARKRRLRHHDRSRRRRNLDGTLLKSGEGLRSSARLISPRITGDRR
jgi:hypothetical protein